MNTNIFRSPQADHQFFSCLNEFLKRQGKNLSEIKNEKDLKDAISLMEADMQRMFDASLQILERGSHAAEMSDNPYFFECSDKGDYIFLFENMDEVRDFGYWEWMTDEEVVEDWNVDREKFEKFVDAYNGDCLKTFAENLILHLVVWKMPS